MYLSDGSGLIQAHAGRPMTTRGVWSCREFIIDDMPVLLHSLVGGTRGHFKMNGRWYSLKLYEMARSTRFSVWHGTLKDWLNNSVDGSK